ncbi:MipA/OmpV family protein [Niveispirillum sp. BGYR6]|uniref:MipA/OmpV family protein n=1 Tax=Niveispirillum sp. BGYR6 TaxID=2971249 RepID=UPI0022B9B7E0|nr:MipA/OmpV family protein [Niveispirillum sp. BGYR6]MDG5496064.1 MipA/OmpV family protein [Niveispirillum sp. BGYR6]
MRGLRLPFLLAAWAAGTPVLADEAPARQWSAELVAGVGARPDYLGSDDMELTPYVEGRFAYDRYFLEAQGMKLSLGMELTPHLALGPMVDFANGRDDKVKNDRVALLPEIDDAVETGGFIRYGWQGIFSGRDELTLDATYQVDVSDTHDGAIGSVGLTYGRKLGDRWSVGTSVRLTYVDDKYAKTYFGITPAASTVSGLPVYNPGGGVRDVGISAKVGYALSENWSVQLLGNYKQLMGDFKDSPIVDLEGSASQLSGAIAIGYRF